MSIEELKAAVDEAIDADLFDLTHIDDEEDLPTDLDLDTLEYSKDPCLDYLDVQILLDDDYPF